MKMGEYTLEDDNAIMAAHIADLDAHTRNKSEIIRTGNYIVSSWVTAYRQVGNTALTADRLYAMPYPIARARTPATLFIFVGVGDGGNPNVRVGLYADDGNLYPAARITNGGVVDVTAAGLKTVVYTVQLTKGMYWLAFIGDGTCSLQSTSGSLHLLGSPATPNSPDHAWYVADTYGNLPDPFPAGATGHQVGYCVGMSFSSND